MPPAGAAEFAADNERFFTEMLPGRARPLGCPGGSEQAGPVGADTPLVRAWGRQPGQAAT